MSLQFNYLPLEIRICICKSDSKTKNRINIELVECLSWNLSGAEESQSTPSSKSSRENMHFN